VPAIALGGCTLHAGGSASIVLHVRPGPLTLRQAGFACSLADLRILRTDQGVQVGYGPVCIDLVEHLAAALGGMGVTEGLEIVLVGPEVPLLDGGAYRFASSLAQLGFSATCVPFASYEGRLTASENLSTGFHPPPTPSLMSLSILLIHLFGKKKPSGGENPMTSFIALQGLEHLDFEKMQNNSSH